MSVDQSITSAFIESMSWTEELNNVCLRAARVFTVTDPHEQSDKERTRC